MLHHLVHCDQIETAIGKRKALADADREHLAFEPAPRNLNGTDPAALSNSIRLYAECPKSSLPAGHHKAAQAGADIQHPGPRRRGPEIGDGPQNVFSIVAENVLGNPFLPLRRLNTLPVLPAILQD